MEQRREPRFEAEQEVAVTVLGECEVQQVAKVKNASGRGLALEMPGPVAPGAAIKIQFDDAVVLGEAVYCRRSPDACLVGVELDQVLCGLTELGRKLQEFATGETSGRQVAYTLDDGHGQDHEQSDNQ